MKLPSTMRLPIGILLQLFAIGISAEEAAARLHACRSEPDIARRVECYDREVDAQLAQVRSEPVAPQSPADRFGYGDVREREERAAELSGRAPSELRATVVEVSKRSNGRHVITLDNGQVWGETSHEAAFRVSVGEEIRVSRAALGTFLLSTPSNRSTRVSRIR